MKLWFFVEGHSEVHFVKNLMQEICPTYIRVESILDFVTAPESNLYYYQNCKGVDKIPYEIQDSSYLIRICSQPKIIIICDKEKLPCLSSRTAVVTNVDDSLIKPLIKVVIFDPMIERYYWNHPNIVSRILVLIHREKFSRSPSTPNLAFSSGSPLGAIQDLFKNHKVKYHKNEFAEMFFARAPLGTDDDPTISRARLIIRDNNSDCNNAL